MGFYGFAVPHKSAARRRDPAGGWLIQILR